MPAPLILNDYMEGPYHLDDVNSNPNIHRPVDAVRTTFNGALGYTP
jgi:hypothetical protein